jgi:hypothetical protein
VVYTILYSETPEIIAAFIRCCGLNRTEDPDDAIDFETMLIGRNITEAEATTMQEDKFTIKRKNDQDSWWWVCRGLVKQSLRKVVRSIDLFHKVCFHTGEWDEIRQTGNPMESDIVRVCVLGFLRHLGYHVGHI